MKIRADRKELAEALGWVGQAVPKRPTSPALGGMKLSAEGDTLTIYGFDYEVGHLATLQVDGIADGACLVPAGFLTTFVGALRGDTAELVLDGDELAISAGRSRYAARKLPLADYPKMPEQAPAVGTVDGQVLAEAVASVRRGASTDGMVPILTALSLTADSTGLHLGATNRYLAIRADLDWSGDAFEALPIATALEAATKGLVGQVTIGVTENLISLSSTGRSVTLRLLEGTFPPIDRFIDGVPVDYEVEVEGVDLARAVVNVGKLAEIGDTVDLHIADGAIEITTSTERGSGVEDVDCSSTGAGVKGFNPQYLASCLSAMPEGPVRIAVGGRGKPAVIRPIDSDDRAALIMGKGDAR